MRLSSWSTVEVEMRFFERRRRGFTFGKIKDTVAELLNAQAISRDDSPAVIAALVVAELAGADMAAEPGVDWEGLIAFVEALVPLILMILEALQ